MLSHAEDGVAKSCWQWRCRGDLTAVRCRCQVVLVIVLLSHANDGAAKSCWWRCCRILLVTALLSPPGDSAAEPYYWRRYQVLMAMVLPTPVGDGAAEAMLGVARYHCRGDMAMAWCIYRVLLHDRSWYLRSEPWCATEVKMYLHYNHV
jgi:hypothetical protein